MRFTEYHKVYDLSDIRKWPQLRKDSQAHEEALANCQPPDAGVVAFGVAPPRQLHDDGAHLRGGHERQDLEEARTP